MSEQTIATEAPPAPHADPAAAGRRSRLPSPNGGDLLVALMRRMDVTVAFGVVSVHNLPLVDAVSRELRFVPVRHEAAAVNAADAYSRATGRIGVAITSTGTGAGNAAGAVIEALSAGSSVLHITGQIDSDRMGLNAGFIHETKDQIAMLTAVSKNAYTVYAASSAGGVLEGAAREALEFPRGPVSVEWPIDLQYRPCDLDQESEPASVPAPASAVPAETIAEAVRLVRGARRPLIWAGGGAMYATREVEQLLSRTRAGLLTSNAGRGVVDEGHAACVGNFATSGPVRELLAEADLLITIGSHFRSNETADYTLALPRPHVQIDIDPHALGRVHPADVGIAAEAGAALRQLLEALPEQTGTDADWLARVAMARRLARQGMREAIGWQAEICDAARAAFPAGSVFARDVTIPSSTWGNRLFGLQHPRTNIFARGGGIGQGLAMGIGAAIACPDLPTLALVGDGGVSVHLGEFVTLAQERPWLIVLVYNDRGYGVLRNTQDAYMASRSGVDLTTPDFGLLARALDLPHWRVRSTDEIEGALADALSTRGPAIVEVDVDALGAMPSPFTPPVTIPLEDPSAAEAAS